MRPRSDAAPKLPSRLTGKTDPFGLLVLAVTLALLGTITLQAMASLQRDRPPAAADLCGSPCIGVDARH